MHFMYMMSVQLMAILSKDFVSSLSLSVDGGKVLRDAEAYNVFVEGRVFITSFDSLATALSPLFQSGN